MNDTPLVLTNKRIDDLRDEITQLKKEVDSVKKTIWFASGFFSALSFVLSHIVK